MKNHGKAHLLAFSDEEISKLKNCFKSLDVDGGGSICIDELKVPLIGLGLVDSLKEVKDVIERVDEDGSGEIEFNEFLDIIMNFDTGANQLDPQH